MTKLWRQMLGETIRAERRERGQRLVDVAATAGISPQYLSEIERGRKEPSSEMVEAVAGALDISVLDLVRRVAGVEREPVTVAVTSLTSVAPAGHGDLGGSVVALAA